MESQELFKLMQLIYKLDSLGVNNILVRSYFDRDGKMELHKAKNWSKFIKEHTDILLHESEKIK